MDNIKIIENGSVTTPAGFKASGVTAGLKKSGNPDMALVFSEKPCRFGAAFTSCTFAAAPVQISRQHAENSEFVQAMIINSGNANACTGKKGLENVEKMCGQVAGLLGITPDAVMVASTGRIGVQMPMDIIEKGIALACPALTSDGGETAARAIMTTDTVPKHVAAEIAIDGKTVRLGAMTKGVGMIDPKLNAVPHATMICVVTTDAEVGNSALAGMMPECTADSFNRITVDGDMSTNDTVLVMANGASGVKVVPGSSGEKLFRSALLKVMQILARKMVMDGEGATKFIEVSVVNAADVDTAKLCAEAVANSLLCKTAWFGCDPNWGRVIAAVGYSGAKFDPDKVNVFYNRRPVVKNGGDAGTPEAELALELKGRELKVTIELNNGSSSYWVWTSDISYEYVKINAEYHT
ncbi:MAG: bifunctional glutamate N-acetyltransferase/amino-acid acetyltransferase ArgJ [Victivallaceae bacterium]|nr:bifunctional glutamate N-acetyltransferase/amino-acid acetyltransferase ArgJ [Victivallaceae bacterium]